MDYVALAAEIALPKYAGMSDDAIAAVLATPIIIKQDVPLPAVAGYLGARGLLVKMEDWVTANPAPSQARTCARELLGGINRPQQPPFHMSDPEIFAAMQGSLSSLGAAGVLSDQNVADLLAMSDDKTTRAAQLGFGENCDMAQEILAARKGA